jgi:hypothetical protein
MPPKESDHLLFRKDADSQSPNSQSDNKTFQLQSTSFNGDEDGPFCQQSQRRNRFAWCLGIAGVVGIGILSAPLLKKSPSDHLNRVKTGPYALLESAHGHSFIESFEFLDGPDSLGSAGFNTYVGYERAKAFNLFNVTNDNGVDYVYISSQPTKQGLRESIRLEGKHRYNSGLFILDVDHTPAGCGIWPAFWLTDETDWPKNGEIDILEGINTQRTAKTALHTSESCSMYAHVPNWLHTGFWDRSSGLPDTYTGKPDELTNVPADNCWVMAAHQWANQGCVAVSERNDTLGEPLNRHGGGIFALQWDPENRYIRSWVFPKDLGIPSNLQDAMDSATAWSKDKTAKVVSPDPDQWGLPYGYFAIGETTGCSANHFANMRMVINTAFCGTVAGNRFFSDCPELAQKFNIDSDPIKTCNAYVESQPQELEQNAYWKIRGIFAYDRTWETKIHENQ